MANAPFQTLVKAVLSMLLNEKLNFGAPLEIETYMQYVTQILVAHKSLTFNMSPSVQS